MIGGAIAVAFATLGLAATNEAMKNGFKIQDQNNKAFEQKFAEIQGELDKQKGENTAIMVTSLGGMGIAFCLGIMSGMKKS